MYIYCAWEICQKIFHLMNGMKETRLNGYVYNFSLDYFRNDAVANQNSKKYLMNKTNIK